jgi:hypothetical protein
MKENKYSPTSNRTIITGVKSLFKALEIKWPVDGRDLRIVTHGYEPTTPIMDIDDVARLINAAKQSKYPNYQVCMLSTLYGFRRQELADIMSAGLGGYVIDINTVKTGTRRIHTIPPPLSKALTFKGKPMTIYMINYCFETLIRSIRDPRPREGWHTIRRSLVTELLDRGLAEFQVSKFMGWTRTETSYKYYKPKRETVDNEVYAVHPYIPIWLKQ